MLYERLKPLRVYNTEFRLPRGDGKVGFGNALFVASKSQSDTLNIMNTDFFAYRQSYYKHYYIESVYKEKIGTKKIFKNEKKTVKDLFDSYSLEDRIKFVPYASRKSIFNKEFNIVVDLGEWHDLFFRFIRKSSAKMLCENYINFLANKLNDSFFSEYKKVLYIDLFHWFANTDTKVLKIDAKSLNNPLSMILFTVYRYPELISRLGNLDIIIADSIFGQVMKIDTSLLTKDNLSQIKSRLKRFQGITYVDEDTEEIVNTQSIPEEIITKPNEIIEPKKVIKDKPVSDTIKTKVSIPTSNKIEDKTIKNTTTNLQNRVVVDRVTNRIVDNINDSIEKEKEKRKINIVNSLKKNLIGEVEDLTEIIKSDDDTGDETSEVIKIMDGEFDQDVDIMASEYMEDNPDILDDIDDDEVVKEIEDFIKKKIYVAKIGPSHSEKDLKVIKKLEEQQKIVIGLPSFKDIKSKMIEETDFSDFVETTNPNIVKSKFRNFNRSYNTKKLKTDIDDAVSILGSADYPIFIVDKSEEDTSDQLNLKKTLTYKLEDINGKKMTLKFDIPTIIEDSYIYLNGSKKIIQNQLILKPLVKTAPDAVQIVSFYNKIYIRRRGETDKSASALKKLIMSSIDKYLVKYGNSIVKNRDYKTTLEYDILAKSIYEFSIGSNKFIMDISDLFLELDSKKIDYSGIDLNKNLIVGYNRRTKKVLYFDRNVDFSDYLIGFLDQNEIDKLSKTKVGRLMYAQATILEKDIPLILFMLFMEGFKTVMEKSGIEYDFIPKDSDRTYDDFEYGSTKVSNGVIIWKRYPSENSLLMNGLQRVSLENYTFEELESKETYIYLMSQFYAYANMTFNLDQFKDFMIDNVTKEVLIDHSLPTDLVTLLAHAVTLLTDNDFVPENDLRNMRVRSNELIAFHVYNSITSAYNQYRKTQHKKNPSKLSIKQDSIMTKMKKSKLIEENSVLNPVLELEKNRAVTYKGERGINLEKALTLPKRGYDESMLGVLGISTSPDANVGIVRQLTLEPNITSTRGYIKTTGLSGVEELNSANLLTPAELLTPKGVQHDDPTRTSMAYKQSKYMLMVDDADPVLIGNKVESIIPYHMSDEFSIVAADDGKVVDDVDGILVIQYKDGTYKSIDINPQVKKNASSGFYVLNTLKTEKKLGDKIKKGEVVAYNDKSFKRNELDDDVAMNLGVLVKIASISNWDIFEDSKPITKSLSKRMMTTMISEKEVSLSKETFIDYMVDIGDNVKTGDVLIKFDSSHDDPFAAAFLDAIREEHHEEVIADNITTIRSNYTGEIVDIKIFSTTEINNLSPTLKRIVGKYYRRLNKKMGILDKYSNPGDSKYYKSGMLVGEVPEKVSTSLDGKIKGVKVDEGVLIIFYIKYDDLAAKGDKTVSEFALKGIVSHVVEEGLEPYSEYRPDEEISTIVAPLAISARKTATIFPVMFGNKLLIEAKRQLEEIYLKD